MHASSDETIQWGAEPFEKEKNAIKKHVGSALYYESNGDPGNAFPAIRSWNTNRVIYDMMVMYKFKDHVDKGKMP